MAGRVRSGHGAHRRSLVIVTAGLAPGAPGLETAADGAARPAQEGAKAEELVQG
ncbi:MAG: hypothetical protein ACM3ML_16355 [Micromonosporaceae bacterium]